MGAPLDIFVIVTRWRKWTIDGLVGGWLAGREGGRE